MPRPPCQIFGTLARWCGQNAPQSVSDVVEAGAHQPKRNRPDRDRVGEIGINAAAAKLAPRDPPAEQHAAGQQERRTIAAEDGPSRKRYGLDGLGIESSIMGLLADCPVANRGSVDHEPGRERDPP